MYIYASPIDTSEKMIQGKWRQNATRHSDHLIKRFAFIEDIL